MVALVIGRVLFLAPSALLWESLALVSLGAASLLLELAAEDGSRKLRIDRLKTRPGSTSGIFLGAVTLPIVMLSRLIQLYLGLSEHHSEIPELENLRLQFWAACACSLGVLFFLHFVLWYSSEAVKDHSPVKRMQILTISMSFVVAFGIQCSFSMMRSATLSQSVELVLPMVMVWLLLHALVSGIVLQYILHKFPSCVSIGEALLVVGGLVLYFSDMLAFMLSKVNLYAPLASEFFGGLNKKRDEISTIIQALLGSLLLMSRVYKVILHFWNCCTNLTKFQASRNDGKASGDFERSITFYVALGITATMIVPGWLFYIKDFQSHPLFWVIGFILEKPLERLLLCIYWLAVTCFAILRFYNISKNSMIERILLRKYYHLLAIIMFVPALLFDTEFLKLSFGAALAGFLILEMIRIWRILPLGSLVNQFMKAFTDHRDSEILIISHFSLLLGCAIPIWMSGYLNDRPLAPFAGILSLGIGDTMASLVGHKYGVLRWSKGGKKTIEGTAAGITSMLLACLFLLPSLAWSGFTSSQDWLSLVFAVILAGLLEAYTTQLDNAFIPLIFYSLLCL